MRDRAAVVEHGDDVGQRRDQAQVVLDDEDRAARVRERSQRVREPLRARPRSSRPRARRAPAPGAPVATARASCSSRRSPAVSSVACGALGQADEGQHRPRALVVMRGAQREQDLPVRRQRGEARVALERARDAVAGDGAAAARPRARAAPSSCRCRSARSARGSRPAAVPGPGPAAPARPPSETCRSRAASDPVASGSVPLTGATPSTRIRSGSTRRSATAASSSTAVSSAGACASATITTAPSSG